MQATHHQALSATNASWHPSPTTRAAVACSPTTQGASWLTGRSDELAFHSAGLLLFVDLALPDVDLIPTKTVPGATGKAPNAA
jgi:hypothetical protein